MLCMFHWLTFLGDIVIFTFILGYFLVKPFLIAIWGFHLLGNATKGLRLHGTLASQLINKDFSGKTEWDLSISKVKSHIP